MRHLPHRRAKDFAFCFKCNQSHELPVGRLCQVFALTLSTNMAETASNSSTSSIPLGQTAVESPPRPQSLANGPDDNPPDKLDAILQHLKHLDEELKKVKKSQQQGHSDDVGQSSSPPRQGYVPPPTTRKQVQGSNTDIWAPVTQTTEDVAEDLVLPSTQFLRTNGPLRRQVDKRLQELDQDDRTELQGKRLKSGLVRHQENHVRVDINWPHEFCYSTDRSCPSYDNLTVMQFSQGFIGCILEEENSKIRQNMLMYLQQLYQDAQETNWYTAKSAHKILLLEMERGKLTWKDNSRVHQIRARYTQWPIHPSQTDKKGGISKPAVPCKFYNNGNCIHEGEHMDGHVLQKHACAYCYRMVKRFCYHSESSCNRKQMKGKNDQ